MLADAEATANKLAVCNLGDVVAPFLKDSMDLRTFLGRFLDNRGMGTRFRTGFSFSNLLYEQDRRESARLEFAAALPAGLIVTESTRVQFRR
jgi:hypothetical protein